MSKIPSSILSVTSLLAHVIGIPIFYLGFILMYDSRWITLFIGSESDMTTTVFNTLMLTSILIGVLCASRIPMTALRKDISFAWWQYILICIFEMCVFSAFAALYMALTIGSIGYFPALGTCLRVTFAILPYPYLLFPLFSAYIRPDKKETADEEDLVRFADNTGRLKLVIANDVILFIEAQENYVSIHYMEGEKMKEYTLRQSMRGIEELMQRHGIIRCQRSYFVNPRHVKVLRRDKEGFIQAELDVRDSRPVPVSPKYYEQLSKLL